MEYETETEASSMVSVSQGICQFNNWNSHELSPSNDSWKSNQLSSLSGEVRENLNSALIIETWPEEETKQWHRWQPNNLLLLQNEETSITSFGFSHFFTQSKRTDRQGQIAPIEKTADFFSFWLDFFGKKDVISNQESAKHKPRR